MPTPLYKLQPFTGKDGLHYWRLVRAGQTIATSEGYKRKFDRNRVMSNLFDALRDGAAQKDEEQ